MIIDDFDFLCLCTKNRRENPMNNAEWLCEDYDRFCAFFNALANGRFDELEKDFKFVPETDTREDFNKWLVKPHE